MPAFLVEIDQPLVGKPIVRDCLPCFVSAADPGHAAALLRSNIYLPLAGVPLKVTEAEPPAETAPDWRTMIYTAEAYAEWQAARSKRVTESILEQE